MTVQTARHETTVSTVRQALDDLDGHLKDRSAVELRTVATGFSILDEVINGGLHAGELLLLGGPPGVGKTICALQWARNQALSGQRVVYACFEHEPVVLLTRLLALEIGAAGGDPMVVRRLEQELEVAGTDARGLVEIVGSSPDGARALEAVERYADDLLLVRASGARTTVDELRAVVSETMEPTRPTILYVDYLQKVPVHPEPRTEAEKVTRVVERLKDLALDLRIPVVLISAVDAEGMRASRLRMYHLRGSSAIAFESDVILMMNDKMKAVSKVHLTYDAVRARGFRDWVVFTVEKNRGGPNLVDLEFRKDFSRFRFVPDGGLVAERLVSERIDEDEV